MARAVRVLVPVLVFLAGVQVRAGDLTLVDEPAPTFNLASLNGDTVSLADFRGKTVVLHFGTGW